MTFRAPNKIHDITVLMTWPVLIGHPREALSLWRREAHRTRLTRYGVVFTIQRKEK